MAEDVEVSSQAAERQSGTASTSGRSGPQTLREEVQQDRAEVCDKLIKVFQAKPPDEWRKLIAVSKQWPLLCDRSACLPLSTVQVHSLYAFRSVNYSASIAQCAVSVLLDAPSYLSSSCGEPQACPAMRLTLQMARCLIPDVLQA